MKKILQSVVVRALIYLAMGILFIVYSHQVSNWLVVLSGSFFMLTGTIVLLNHWWKRKENPSILYPVVALGAISFGGVLILFSPLFLTGLRTCVAVFLFAVGLVQLYSLWSVIRAGAKLSFAYNLVPLSGIAAAVFVFFYRHFTPEDPFAFQLLGAALIVYALFEMLLAVYYRKVAQSQPIPAGKKPEQGKAAAPVATQESTQSLPQQQPQDSAAKDGDTPKTETTGETEPKHP